MGFLPFLHFFNFLVCVYLAIYVLVKNPKSPLHKILSVFLISICIWSFGKIFTDNPDTSKETVKIFIRTGSLGWCTFSSLFLYFAMIFAKKKELLKNKLLNVSMIAIPALFIYLQWNDSLVRDCIPRSFGWSFLWAETAWPYLFFSYILASMGAGFYLILYFGNTTDDRIKKKQAKIISLTALAALLIGAVTDLLLPKIGIHEIPPMGDMAVIIWTFGIVYSITRYEFLITPARAAGNIISTMADSLILLDQNGDIVDVNKSTLDLIGYTREELIGQSARIFLVEKNFNKNLLEIIVKEDSIKNYELVFQSKNGDYIPVIFSSSALRDESGSTAGVVCTAHDITERNRRKEELKKAKEELENQAKELIRANEKTTLLNRKIEETNRELMLLNDMKSEFLSMVSHEIKTPLSIMKQFVSILADQIPGKINKDQKEYLGIINNNISRLALIVNDLLDISKLESGKMKFTKERTTVSPLIENAVESFRTKAKNKNVRLAFRPEENLPELFIDPNRITQVLVNLIENALKFSPEKGEITIDAKQQGEFVEVGVSDQGPGIAPENLDKVFERFGQIGQTAGNQGTGLGLSIAKKIIELHSGRIWAESPGPENKGSRFVFLLPK